MIKKKNVPLYFYDTIDDTFQRTKPILDDLTPIMLYRGRGAGGVEGRVWPLKCVLFWNLHLRVQMV